MTTSGSTDFTLQRNAIIRQAFRKIGKGTEGQDLSDYQVEDGATELNMLVKEWENEGLHLWKKIDGEFPLVVNQARYVFGGTGGAFATKMMRILSAQRKDNNNREIPMLRLGRQDYDRLPNKLTAGIPSQFYYEPKRVTGDFLVWPVPIDANQSVAFTGEAQIEDFDNLDDEADLPVEWLSTIVYNLADRLADNYGAPPTIASRVSVRASLLYEELLGWDQENASVYIQPAYQFEE